MGDPVSYAQQALSLATNNILLDESVEQQCRNKIVCSEYDPGHGADNKCLRCRFVLESIAHSAPLRMPSSVWLCGRTQERALLQQAIIATRPLSPKLATCSPKNRLLFIQAASGAGKTVILCQLMVVAPKLIACTRHRTTL